MGLLEEINRIDAEHIARATKPFENYNTERLHCQWEKGCIIVKFHPELLPQIEAPQVGGRPSAGRDLPVSFSAVAKEINRSTISVQKWVKMAHTVGTADEDFRAYLPGAIQALYDKETTKLIASDVREDDAAAKQKEKRKITAVLADVMRRVEENKSTANDARQLAGIVKFQTTTLEHIEELAIEAGQEKIAEQARKAIAKVKA